MDDLISRQAAIDALNQIFDRCEEIEAHLPKGDPDRTGYKMYPDYMIVWKYLHQLPSAEPEIIRCKDCKFFAMPHELKNYPTFGVCSIWNECSKQEDYCSYAERKENGKV